MNLRLARMDDLPQLKSVYRKIIENMDRNNIRIWDEIYPCEFFSEDIENDRLYILVDNSDTVSAFALSESNSGEDHVQWADNNAKALYIDRFGVNVDYLRSGIGSLMLKEAVKLAKDMSARYLRLFVVDINEPAIKLYMKNGFKMANGTHEEVIDDNTVFSEYGFEIEIPT